MRWRLVALLCGCAWCGRLGRALGDEDPAAIEAKRHFQSATEMFARGDYDQAVDEFLRAYQWKPHPSGLYSIALAYERIYKPSEARTYYERFLQDSPEPSEERRKAEVRLKVLRTLPGSIVVNASKPGARVHLTGGIADKRAHTPARFDELPPADYQVRVELVDHVAVTLPIHLEPGEHQAVTVPLEHQMEMLTIESRPVGARVFVDGKVEGLTPFSRPLETGTRRRLRVEVEDYPPLVEVVDLVPGKPVKRELVFKRPYASGRTELVLGAMAYGSFAAVGLAEVVGVEGLDAPIRIPVLLLASVGGIGVGFLVASRSTDDYVKVGHSSIIGGATLWGTMVGVGVSLGLKLDGASWGRYTWGTAIVGGGLGTATGLLVARYNDTSPGDAAVVNTGALWGTIAGLLLAPAIHAPVDYQLLGWLSVGGCALGLTAGALAAWGVEVSRGHVAMIDVGGGAGLALGFGIGLAAQAATASDSNKLAQVGSQYGLGGMVVGLVAAAILTRNYNDDLPLKPALATRKGGEWSLGFPTAQLGYGPAHEPRINVTLLQGEF